jgi:hypothetical protein
MRNFITPFAVSLLCVFCQAAAAQPQSVPTPPAEGRVADNHIHAQTVLSPWDFAIPYLALSMQNRVFDSNIIGAEIGPTRSYGDAGVLR